MSTKFGMIRTSREQYLVGETMVAAVKCVNALHSANQGEIESVNMDINCIDKVACHVASFISDNEAGRVAALDQAIHLLERAKKAATEGGLTLRKE